MNKSILKITISFVVTILMFSSLDWSMINNDSNKQNVHAASKGVQNNSNKVINDYFRTLLLEEQKKSGVMLMASSNNWIKKAKKFAEDTAKVGIDFLFLDDIKTIFNPKASSVSKSLAIIALFPAGKIVKGAKAFKLLEKYGKSSLAEATARYGSSKVLGSTSKGILLEGNSKRGWKHIYTSHVTKTQGKSTFPGHLSTKQIKDKIYYTLNHGKVVHAADSGNITYSCKFGKKGLKYLHVIVDKSGYIVTAFPSKTYK